MPTHLLWTGGWDSTFRLLQLVLSEGQRVEPHYIVDADRLSTGVELRTMQGIKTELVRAHPETAGLLGPTRLLYLQDIAAEPRITEAFARIRARIRIGGQYEWLARYCAAAGHPAMELCIHRDDRAHALLADQVRDGRIRCDSPETDEWTLFRHFVFPVFELSKLDMAGIAARNGWLPLLETTWFCHRPRANGDPCGVCAPCTYVIEEGLGRRIPRAGRWRAWLRRTRGRLFR